MNDAVAGLRARPRTTILLAVLLIGTGLVLGLAREAIAYTFDTRTDTGARGAPRDSDGTVPESVGDLNGYTYGDGWIEYGRTNWWVYTAEPYQETRARITYDWAATDYCKVRRYRVADHEKAHSRGWGHGYGHPDPTRSGYNPAYYAEVRPCEPWRSTPI